jgi:hypothetical protein
MTVDRYLQKVWHPPARLGGEFGHSNLDRHERPALWILEALSDLRSLRICVTSTGQ